MKNLLLFASLALWSAAACSGSGSGSETTTTGAVHVVIDTATGADGLVQFQVTGAVLGDGTGAVTGNLLAAAEVVTFADPSGEASALELRAVPTGNYATLHLVLVPGSGQVLRADGSVTAIAGPVDLAIPIADGLQHDNATNTWLAVGHGLGNAITDTGSGLVWSPALTGRFDGSEHELGDLAPVLVDGETVVARDPANGGLLRVEFAPDCAFTAEDDGRSAESRGEFLQRVREAGELRVRGDLHRDGRLLARDARRGRGHDGVRFLGRIVTLEPATESFVFRVQAETRRGGERRILTPPRDVRVLTQNAVIRRPAAQFVLTFADLAVGNLAKVKPFTVTAVPGGLTEIGAREIEVTSGDGVPPQPEWQGRVTGVDLVLKEITVEPRNDDPIVIGGVSVPVATVRVDAQTWLERRERQGPGRFVIELGDIVPGQDRIWWRGSVVGPATVLARWVRVRED